jgi:hypothetical protein
MVKRYGTDEVVFQTITGTLQSDDGSPLITTASSGIDSVVGSLVFREIFYGVTNGDFSAPAQNIGTADFISENNSLPYWDFAQVASPSTGTVGFQSLADTTTPSGYKLRAIATAGATTAGTATLTRRFLLGTNGARDVAIFFTASFVLGTATAAATNRTLAIKGVYYASDGTSVVGTAVNVNATYNDYLTLGSGTVTWFDSGNTYLPPSTASLLEITLTNATTGTNVSEQYLDIVDLSVYRTPPQFTAYGVNDPTKRVTLNATELRAGTAVSGAGLQSFKFAMGTAVFEGGTLKDDVNIYGGTIGFASGGTAAPDVQLYRTSGTAFAISKAVEVSGRVTGAGETTNLHHGITLQRTTNLTLGTAVDGSATAITWSSAVKNTTLYAYWSTGSTIAIPVTGWYSVTCHLISGTGLGTGFAFRLYALVNGTVIAETETQAGANTTSDTFAISTLAYMTAGDSLVFRASASSASKTIGGSRRSACSVIYIGNTSS